MHFYDFTSTNNYRDIHTHAVACKRQFECLNWRAKNIYANGANFLEFSNYHQVHYNQQ